MPPQSAISPASATPGPITPVAVSPWLLSKRQDLAFIVLSPLLSVVCLVLFLGLVNGAKLEVGATEFVFYVIFAVGFDNPHILQTFSRTHWDRVERSRHPFLHFGILGALIGLAIVWPEYIRTGGFQVFFAIFGLWHIYAQNVGFLKLYGRRDATTEAIRKTERFVYFMLFSAYLTRVGVVDLPGVEDLGSWGTLSAEYLRYLGWALLIVTTLGALRLAYLYHVSRSSGLLRLGPRIGLFLCLCISYSTNYIALDYVPVLAMLVLDTLYHDLQYLRWMAHYQTKMFPIKRIAMKWMAGCLVLGTIFEFGNRWGVNLLGSAIPATAIFISLTVYHYYVDGVVWKFHRQKELGALMK